MAGPLIGGERSSTSKSFHWPFSMLLICPFDLLWIFFTSNLPRFSNLFIFIFKLNFRYFNLFFTLYIILWISWIKLKKFIKISLMRKKIIFIFWTLYKNCLDRFIFWKFHICRKFLKIKTSLCKSLFSFFIFKKFRQKAIFWKKMRTKYI